MENIKLYPVISKSLLGKIEMNFKPPAIMCPTCGSGKTTVAEQFAKMNWYVIDGDCAIQSLRYKTGIKNTIGTNSLMK